MSGRSLRLPVEGDEFFLTSRFIEQAFHSEQVRRRMHAPRRTPPQVKIPTSPLSAPRALRPGNKGTHINELSCDEEELI